MMRVRCHRLQMYLGKVVETILPRCGRVKVCIPKYRSNFTHTPVKWFSEVMLIFYYFCYLPFQWLLKELCEILVQYLSCNCTYHHRRRVSEKLMCLLSHYVLVPQVQYLSKSPRFIKIIHLTITCFKRFIYRTSNRHRATTLVERYLSSTNLSTFRSNRAALPEHLPC